MIVDVIILDFDSLGLVSVGSSISKLEEEHECGKWNTKFQVFIVCSDDLVFILLGFSPLCYMVESFMIALRIQTFLSHLEYYVHMFIYTPFAVNSQEVRHLLNIRRELGPSQLCCKLHHSSLCSFPGSSKEFCNK